MNTKRKLNKTNSVKWKNVFAIVFLFFTAALVWNAINYNDVRIYKEEHQIMKDSLSVIQGKLTEANILSESYHCRINELIDSCENLTISYLNDTFEKYIDTTSAYWYVSWETKKLTGYDVIKLPRSSFSLIEAQSLIKKGNNVNGFLNILFFEQVSEKCWAEYNKE
jgi:hypothetical protein